MCVPVAVIAAAGIAGGALSGISAWSDSNNNARNLDMQAAGIQRNINAEKESSAFEIARTRDTIARTQGAQRAGFAANGLALSGSAYDVLLDTATEGALDVEAIRWNSKVKTDNMKYEQQVAKQNAKSERQAGPIRFATQVLGSVAKFGGSFG